VKTGPTSMAASKTSRSRSSSSATGLRSVKWKTERQEARLQLTVFALPPFIS
jgi:hypothetical protein